MGSENDLSCPHAVVAVSRTNDLMGVLNQTAFQNMLEFCNLQHARILQTISDLKIS